MGPSTGLHAAPSHQPASSLADSWAVAPASPPAAFLREAPGCLLQDPRPSVSCRLGYAPPLPWPVWLNLEKGDDGPCHPLPWYKEHRFSGSSRGGSLWSPQGTASADLTSVFLPLSCLWLNIQPPPLSSFLRVTVLSPRPYRFCFLSTFAPAEPKVERSSGLGQAPGPQGAPLLSLRH